MSTRWSYCLLFFLFSGWCADSARSQSKLQIDEKIGTTNGWTIGYNSSVSGCLASVKYNDDTTLWLGIDGRDNSIYLALTNPNWQSIESGKEYELRFSTLVGARWQGNFIGISRETEKGIISGGLKDKFVSDIVRSSGIAISLGNKPIARLSLQGSPAALSAITECHSSRNGNDGSPDRKAHPKGVSMGTGFFVSSKGYVLTNAHVVDGCSTVNLEQPGRFVQSGQVIAIDKNNDLALILAATKPSTAPPALRVDVRLGENISVFGFPLSHSLATTGNFTVGHVSALAGLGDNSSQIQISAPIQPGNSGGPVFDRFGNIVAVIVSTATPKIMANASGVMPQNINFAIKAAIATNFLSSNGVKDDGRLISDVTALDTAEIAEWARHKTLRIVCSH